MSSRPVPIYHNRKLRIGHRIVDRRDGVTCVFGKWLLFGGRWFAHAAALGMSGRGRWRCIPAAEVRLLVQPLTMARKRRLQNVSQRVR